MTIFHHTPIMLASWVSQARLPWVLLGTGLVILSIALLVLMLSRLGHARPLAKCVVLSVYAHILLLGYAYMINLFHDSDPKGPGTGVAITLIEETSEGAQPETDWQVTEPATLPEDDLTPPEVAEESTIPPQPTRVRTPIASQELADLPIPQLLDEPVPKAFDRSLLAPAGAATIAAEAHKLRHQDERDIQVDTPRPEPLDIAADIPGPQVDSEETSFDNELQTLADVQTNAETGELMRAEQDRTQAIFTSDRKPPIETGNNIAPAYPGNMPRLYQSRRSAARLQQVISQGGSRETEQAVNDALAWLVRAQNKQDGRWSTRDWGGGKETRDFSNLHGSPAGIQADSAITGLALLSFLGAGHTHLEGPHQATIGQGLTFLIQSQSESTGSLAGNAGRFVAMYCHGIATLALSEAYVLTRDENLKPHLEKALRFTLRAQHPTTGGWRYFPGDTGDTSQFGWQIMSLLSARAAGIDIPEQTWSRANRWLQRVSLGQHGGLACYTPNKKVASKAMTAEALMCRIFLQGARGHSAIEEGANFVAGQGIGPDPMNLYYQYYATVALHQLQDHRWLSWNRALTVKLVSTQETAGEMAGSWDSDTVWGRTGGRVYSTAMATLCLEIYYRYLPIYRSNLQTATQGTLRR